MLTQSNVSWTSQGETQTFAFQNNETAYLYYRLVITANGGGSDYSFGEFVLGQSIKEYKRLLDKYDYLIPAMSSASQDGYVVSASAEFNSDHKAIHAFDKNDSTKWAATATNFQWLQIQLPTTKICNLISIKARNDQWWNQAPTAFEILGSNNGTNWTTLLSESNVIWEFQGQTKTFELPEATYSYYRLQMTSSQAGDYFGLARFDLIHNYKIQEY